MEPIQEKDLIKFIRNNIEPLPDVYHGAGYRASAYLLDGTFLPCVIFRNSRTIVELAKRRFDDEKARKSKSKIAKVGYNEMVKTFVASGNRVNPYDIGKIKKSRSAFPFSILKQIHGETRMGWTAFVVKMKDGKCYSYGTTFLMEFFDLPDGYAVEDINEIINHSYTLKTGEIRSYHDRQNITPKENLDFVYRERPYFECFLDNL